VKAQLLFSGKRLLANLAASKYELKRCISSQDNRVRPAALQVRHKNKKSRMRRPQIYMVHAGIIADCEFEACVALPI
jgi:hypothetical protein